MRGRLGSMGSMSSFERVSVLEDEHENSQSFSRGTLRLLTLTPWHLKACYIPTVSSGKGQVDKNTFTFNSPLRMRRNDFVLRFSPHSFVIKLALTKRQNSTRGNVCTEMLVSRLRLLAPLWLLLCKMWSESVIWSLWLLISHDGFSSTLLRWTSKQAN